MKKSTLHILYIAFFLIPYLNYGQQEWSVNKDNKIIVNKEVTFSKLSDSIIKLNFESFVQQYYNKKNETMSWDELHRLNSNKKVVTIDSSQYTLKGELRDVVFYTLSANKDGRIDCLYTLNATIKNKTIYLEWELTNFSFVGRNRSDGVTGESYFRIKTLEINPSKFPFDVSDASQNLSKKDRKRLTKAIGKTIKRIEGRTNRIYSYIKDRKASDN